MDSETSVDSRTPIEQLAVNSDVVMEEDNGSWFDLHPNRDLLDSSFEGYKLSLDSFAQYKLILSDSTKLDTRNFIESSESKVKYLLFQHLKLFGFQNLLIVNQFNDSDVYYFDVSHRLMKLSYVDGITSVASNRSINPTTLQIPMNTQMERTPASMIFVRVDLAVVYDGHNNLYLCQRSEKISPEPWSILSNWSIPANESPCVLKDAVLVDNQLHLMLIYIEEVVSNAKSNKFNTIVNWFQFELANDLSAFPLKRTRKLNCFNHVPDYIAFETNGSAINIAGPKDSQFVYDSNSGVIPAGEISQTVPEKTSLEGFKNPETDDTTQPNSKSLFTDEQLEECDGIPDDSTKEDDLMLRRLDGNLLKCTHKTYINDNRFLMEVRLDGKNSPAICLRHDVDGVVWQPHSINGEGQSNWLTHEYTFLAFGYVQASKQQAKYKLAPPNCSYVCVVDSNKHVYVYKQAGEKVQGTLRNRKSGKVSSHVSKQYLISLENDQEIYGAYASNNFLLILLQDSIIIYRIISD